MSSTKRKENKRAECVTLRSPAARKGQRKWEMENAQNKQRKINLKWGTFTKYRIEQGYKLKWKEHKRV